MFFDQFPKKMQNKTLSQHFFRSRQLVQLQPTKPKPRSAGMPYKFIKQRRLKGFLGSSSLKKKKGGKSPILSPRGFLDPPVFQGSQTQTTGTMSNGVCLKVTKHRFCCDFFYDQVKDVNHPNIFKSHEDTPPLTTARAREKSGSWEATLPKCSLMVMPHDVEGTQ